MVEPALKTNSHPKRKKLRYKVWKFFDNTYKVRKDRMQVCWAWCILCWKKLNVNSITGMTTLKNHHNKCQSDYERMTTSKTRVVAWPSVMQSTSHGSTFDPHAHGEALIKYNVSADMPISLGEHLTHIEYVRSLYLQYQPVTREYY